jgi:hypothetical protein
LYFKDWWNNWWRPGDSFSKGYLIIEGKEYYAPIYKKFLCWNLFLPVAIVISTVFSGIVIFNQWNREIGYEIMNLIMFYIPLHHNVCKLEQRRNKILSKDA